MGYKEILKNDGPGRNDKKLGKVFNLISTLNINLEMYFIVLSCL